jgi:hypothetical protein
MTSDRGSGIRFNDIKNFKPSKKSGSSCCAEKSIKLEKWMTGLRETKCGKIPLISTDLTSEDIRGGWKARWGINRMDYRIEPGIYGFGDPDVNSPVLVTANYKLTFDKVRKELKGLSGWLLVLDTKGINVWCAAGKGTFGTDELVRRVKMHKISELVSHRTLIVPQLGATGVCAYEVTKNTGFKVKFGPVRACDIKEYINNDYTKTESMRTVHFDLPDRMAISVIELIHSLKYLLIAFIAIGLISLIENRALTYKILSDFVPFLLAFFTGATVFPAVLPYLPFRSFALKGYVLGLILTAIIVLLTAAGSWNAAFLFLVIPPIVSFISLYFTGASTYTSLAGTKVEVSVSLPLIGISICLGLVIKISSLIMGVI